MRKAAGAKCASTRLESFIRRLEAQRRTLDWAARAVSRLDGVVLELGLGNGRTYDHLIKRLAGAKPIHAFDRRLAAHPACVPPKGFLHLGEFRDTLPEFARQHPRRTALVHADTGSGDARASAALARWLGPALAPMLAPGALVLSDQKLRIPGAVRVAPPRGVPPGRYFVYRSSAKAPDRRSPAHGRRGSANRVRRARRRSP